MNWIVAIFLLVVPMAFAHDDYEGLARPDGRGSCCGSGECGPTEIRLTDGNLEAHIVPGNAPEWKVDKWVEVPADKFLPAEANPYVGPSVCWNPYMDKVLCFIPGRGT